MVIIKKGIQKYSNTSIKGFRLAGDPIPRFFLHTRGRERERARARARERGRLAKEKKKKQTYVVASTRPPHQVIHCSKP